MLKIEHLRKTFHAGTINEKRVFTDLNLTVEDGDFVTVIGGNESEQLLFCTYNL